MTANHPKPADQDPYPRWILAFEPTDKELRAAFREVPSAEVIITPTRKNWRKEFFNYGQ